MVTGKLLIKWIKYIDIYLYMYMVAELMNNTISKSNLTWFNSLAPKYGIEIDGGGGRGKGEDEEK